jgi:hypothetical protein
MTDFTDLRKPVIKSQLTSLGFNDEQVLKVIVFLKTECELYSVNIKFSMFMVTI